jgi:hypothetical protein
MVLYDTVRKFGVIALRSAADGEADAGRVAGRARAPATIDTLGITLVTQQGVGQIMIRLRSFSVSIWQ